MNNIKIKIIVIIISFASFMPINADALDNNINSQTDTAVTRESISTQTESFDEYGVTSTSSGLKVKGHAVTGWNKIFGDAATTLRFVGQLSFDVGGVFNPDGPALPIGSDTSPFDLMASYAAPDVYLAFFGVENAQNIPSQNILYADFPHMIKHDSQLGILPQLSENPDWFGKSNGAKNRGLTVGDWISAKGSMKFKCNQNESAFYELTASNLIPGGLYTVWGFYFDQDIGSLMPDFAFGGTSANVFTADRNGEINGARDLNFCPQEVTINDRYVPVNMFLVYHPDGRVHASVGHPVNTPPFIGPGMVATPQLMFPMPAEDF